VATVDDLERPGDYCATQELDADERPTGRGVWFILPTADPGQPLKVFPDRATDRAGWAALRRNGRHRVAEPPWQIRDCPDGSIEIRESIACGRGDPEGEYFHGYLDAGNVWRVL
jgi:hypothetical protein